MRRVALVIGLSVVASSIPARADVVVLRGGGQVQGKVIADPDSKTGDRVLVVLPMGKTPLSLRKNQIQEVIPRPGPLDEYAERREKLEPTARAEFELGEWCDAHGLPDLAEVHYEGSLKRDPEFAEAREKLGRAPKDDLRLASGEADGDEPAPDDEPAIESAPWLRRIKLIHQGLLSEAADRRREAEDRLMAVKDPEAVAAMVKVLGASDPDIRALLARALGGIPGDASSRALVDLLLAEPEAGPRGALLDAMKRRGGDLIPARLARALKSRDVRVVNRAAWALGNLEAFAAVPRLLDVLVLVEDRMVLAPPEPVYPNTLGPPIAFNGSSAAFMQGPVVGPGVVAYGATVLPNTLGFDPFTGAPITYGDGMGPRVGEGYRGPRPQLVAFTTRNAEVLGALTRLTGQDFGYDVAAWRAWVARSFNPKPKPDRKAPQP